MKIFIEFSQLDNGKMCSWNQPSLTPCKCYADLTDTNIGPQIFVPSALVSIFQQSLKHISGIWLLSAVQLQWSW